MTHGVAFFENRERYTKREALDLTPSPVSSFIVFNRARVWRLHPYSVKISTLQFIFVVLLTFFSGMALAQTPTPKFSSQLKIGVLLPLTGPLTELGTAMQNGIALAEEENADIASALEIHSEDSLFDPQTALSLARELRINKGIDLLINFGCHTSRALMEERETAKLPSAFFCSRNGFTKGNSLAFGLTPPSVQWAELLWTYLRKQGYRKMCVVLSDNEYLESEYSSLLAAISESPLRNELKVIERFESDAQDFRSAISKIRSSGCTALGIYLLPKQLQNFFLQMSEQRLRLPVFGTDLLEGPSVIQSAGSGIDGAVYVNLDVHEDFRSKYIKRFGNDHQLAVACIGYNLFSSIFELIRTRGTPPSSGLELLDWLRGARAPKRSCTSGTFVVAADGQQFMGYELVIKKIVRGKTARLTTLPSK